MLCLVVHKILMSFTLYEVLASSHSLATLICLCWVDRHAFDITAAKSVDCSLTNCTYCEFPESASEYLSVCVERLTCDAPANGVADSFAL